MTGRSGWGIKRTLSKAGFRFRTIRSKLIASYALLIIVPCALLGFAFFHVYDRAVVERNMDLAKNEAELLCENIRYTLGGYGEILNDFCFSKDVWQYFHYAYTYPENSIEGYYSLIAPTISKYIVLHPEIKRATFYTTNDTVVTNGTEIALLKEGTWQYDMAQTLSLKEGNAWGFSRQQLGGRDVLVVARMASLYRQPIGLFALYLDYNALIRYIGEGSVTKEAYVISPEGRVIMTTDNSYRAVSALDMELEDAVFGKEIAVYDVEIADKLHKLVTVPFTVTGINGSWYLIRIEAVSELLSLVYMNRIWLACLLGLVTCLMVAVSIGFAHHITARLNAVTQGMREVEAGRFDARVVISGGDEIAGLGDSLNHMAGRLDALVKENAAIHTQKRELEIINKESRLNALQSQINPHFLFNTLEALQYGIEAKLPHTEEVVANLARSLRRITSWKEDMVSLREEIAFVREHLQVQQFRLGGKLSYEINVPEALMGIYLPKMLLQPLVENAAHHGIAMKKGNGNVLLQAVEQEGFLMIDVTDDGVGMDEMRMEELRQALSKPAGESAQFIGLKNVYDRVKLYYGEEGAFEIQSQYGVCSHIRLKLKIGRRD